MRADYADVFDRRTEVRATPERWARAMFGDVPNLAEWVIWQALLHMPLERTASADTIAGWPIRGRGDDWILLENASWFVRATLRVTAADGVVSLATSVRYDRPVARVVWPLLSVVHRRLVPGLLRAAETAVVRSTEPSRR